MRYPTPIPEPIEILRPPGKISWWLITGLTSLVLGIVGLVYQRMDEQIDKVRSSSSYSSERLASLEARSHNIEKRLDDIVRQLEALDGKLDAVLLAERRRQ